MTYILRRLFQMGITLIVISMLGFLIVHSAPGDPFEAGLDPNASPVAKEVDREKARLDEPIYQQYLAFYGDMLYDFRVLFEDGRDSPRFRLKSMKTPERVVPTMMRRMLVTLPYIVMTLLIAWTLAFPVGIYAAMKRGKFQDTVITILSYAMISIPSFWLALLVIRTVTLDLGIPVVAPRTLGVELTGFQAYADRIWHIGVPAFIGALGSVAVLNRYVRGQMLEVLDADYVRTARAKGLDVTTVNYKHALRNAALPFVTMIAGIFPLVFSGSIIFESIYAWPGLGRWAFTAVMARDYTIVMTTLFVGSALTLVGMLVSDLLLMVVDPRIKLK